MFLFLKYFDDNTHDAVDTDYGIFVDDEPVWVHGQRMPLVIDSINKTFQKLYNWSLMNSVVFAAEKFHVFDLTPSQQKQEENRIRHGGAEIQAISSIPGNTH